MKRCFYLLPFLLSTALMSISVEFKEKKISPTQTDIACTFVLQPHEVLYQKNIVFSVDNPDIYLSATQADKDLCSSYDPHFKEHVMVYDENVTFSLTATRKHEDAAPATIHVLYATNNQKDGATSTFPLTFANQHAIDEVHQANQDVQESQAFVKQDEVTGWRAKIQKIKDTVASTDSWPLRLLFVFVLGLLLSLTPCIYPMIPITVGILQAQGSNSL